MTPVKKVIVRRSRWGIGMLRNQDGLQCCLGFCARQAGYKVDEIEETADGIELMAHAYANIEESIEKQQRTSKRDLRNSTAFREAFPGLTDSLQNSIASVNDGHMSVDVKEAQLTKLFNDAGVKIVFVGKLPKDSPHA